MPYTPNFSPGDVLTAANMNSIGEAWSTFTPTWTASGTAPAIGNATVKGRYCQINKVVHARMIITFGSTSTYGTGSYRFALPVTATSDMAAGTAIGSGRLVDVSAPNVYGAVIVNIFDTSKIYLEAGALAGEVGQTFPMTWATGDLISIYYTYEAA